MGRGTGESEEEEGNIVSVLEYYGGIQRPGVLRFSRLGAMCMDIGGSGATSALLKNIRRNL
jgi:hypothetical protein